MPKMLEVDPEVASKIQAGSRERGVSVDVYLRELIDQKELSRKAEIVSARKSEFACCGNGHRDMVPTGRYFLTKQLVVKRSTECAVSGPLGRKKYWNRELLSED
jgi:hypothetical protein